MNIIIEVENFKDECLFYNSPVKNTVMDDSNFIRILYSNKLFTLNGIFIKIKFNITSIEKYFNKFKCSFNIQENKTLIDKLSMIEDKILENCSLKNKNARKKISEQLLSGNIKLFTDSPISSNSNSYLLKISGIWETDTEYGITYKFVNTLNHR